MKRTLPILISFLFFLIFSNSVHAQSPSPTPSVTTTPTPVVTATPDPLPTITIPSTGTGPTEGNWIQDSSVTFVGKVGARSGEFLDWSLQNYSWAYVQEGQKNPIMDFWITIRNIVYAFFTLFVLATAFILIVTRGKNLTITKFIPRFLFIILFVTFSFALIQFLYQITDVIQSFFLKNPAGEGFISQKNLLNIAFNYKEFVGYRKFGAVYDESAFMSLMLVRLTAITYYTMSGILLLRKIILWFFIILSPVFPLLMIYSPIRNTGKIWIGEFFRWLLYAPLFSILLSGLVHIWRTNIPLPFNFNSDVIYPTAVNILIGGPGQVLSLTNSVNNKDSFAQYIVALLMLWVVIILPFILLHIFLDYIKNFSFSENSWVKQVATTGSAIFSRSGTPPPPLPTPPSHQPSGLARSLPYSAKIEIPEIRTENIERQISNLRSAQRDIANLTNLSVPTMRDIARFETASLSKSVSSHQEIAKTHETLEKIANPANISGVDRQKFIEVKGKLSEELQKGNAFAGSVLKASKMVGSKPASSEGFPAVNRVQEVSLDDYETVKKMWSENYETLEPPKGFDGKQEGRKEWIDSDVNKISDTINLLSSADPLNVKKGMEAVGSILPFLMLGGFSQTEVVAYLKAKMEAAKSVRDSLMKKESEEESMLDRKTEKTEKPKEMEAKQELRDLKEIKNPVQ